MNTLDRCTDVYRRQILSHVGKIPTDVLLHVRDKVSFDVDNNTQETRWIKCEICGIPRVPQSYRCRLASRPKKTTLIKCLLRKREKDRVKLSRNEKLRLSLYNTQRNTLYMTCLVCKDIIPNYCHLPDRLKKNLAEITRREKEMTEDSKTKRKAKKKKKKKEENAGLILSSKTVSSNILNNVDSSANSSKETVSSEKHVSNGLDCSSKTANAGDCFENGPKENGGSSTSDVLERVKSSVTEVAKITRKLNLEKKNQPKKLNLLEKIQNEKKKKSKLNETTLAGFLSSLL